MSLRIELGESPAVVERLLDAAAEPIERVAQAVRARAIDLAVIAARGTSDHAAVYAQYILGARNGMVVAPATPSLSSLYDAPPHLARALVLGISQSGRSPDVVSVLADARRQGALTVAVTNEPDSELAGAAEFVIELGAGPELAVAATKTYIAEVGVVAMLSAALSGDAESAKQLRAAPAAMRAALDQESRVKRLAASRARIEECVVLARGFQYATAREWALKLKELTRVLADPYSGADFQHGPIALVEPGFPVLAVASAGPALAGMLELLGRLRDRGGEILTVSDDATILAMGDGVPLPLMPEWLSPLAAIIPAQLFAYHLAVAKGLDPDAPPNLTKVTRTL
ncbi:MAG: SIS domain-containing protein [Chloroflexi bacterium]|nr:SIS domain-containing protein [Chloroflexota bacterium]